MIKNREILLWIFLIFLIIFRYFTTRPFYKNGDKVRITSRIISEPIRYERSQYLKVQGLKIYLPNYPEINYGDAIIISGKVNLIKKSLDDARLIEIIKTNAFLYKLRKKIILFYQKNFPEPHSSLIAGVTIGSKSSIPSDFWQNLKSTGTAHVVVASGMNVSLVAGFLIGLLIIFLPRNKAVVLGIMGVWLYALISGFDAPIIRAAIMGTIAFTAVFLGRVSFAFRTLLLTAAVMLIVSPSWLTDLGFILSFGATASLIVFEARVQRLVRFIPSIFREGLSTSLAAQVGVFPILYYTFGYINPFSPLINALVLWTIPIITVIGMLSGFIGLFIEPLGKLILYLSYPLTSWFIWIIQIFS